MEFSDQALAGENNPSHPTGEEELRVLNKQLREQADELRSLNQDLLNREARLRLSIETGRVGIWVWDATGSVHTLDWSQRLKEIFGLSADAEVTRTAKWSPFAGAFAPECEVTHARTDNTASSGADFKLRIRALLCARF